MMHKRQTAEKDILYIFLHIPKCAGSTFRYHVEHNLKKGEYISLYDGEYFDVTEMAYEYFTPGKRRKEIDEYLARLSDAQKDTIRIVYGHRVYYGIHRFFPGREPRYITFIRHPVARTLSLYNFYRDHVENPSRYPPELWNAYRIKGLGEVHKDIIQNGRTLPFPEWLKKRTWHSNFMTKFLAQQGFAEPNDSVEDMVEKFYFVGITENYRTDALFLYQLLGIKIFYPDQNISKKYVDPKNLPEYTGVISDRNAKDIKLYEHSLRVNKKFKKHTPRFTLVVGMMKTRMWYSGLRTPLEIAYAIAWVLRQHVPQFGRILDGLKKAIRAEVR